MMENGPLQALVSNVLNPLNKKYEEDQRTSDLVDALNREVLQPLRFKDQEQPPGSNYRETFMERLNKIEEAKKAEYERLRILDQQRRAENQGSAFFPPLLSDGNQGPPNNNLGLGLVGALSVNATEGVDQDIENGLIAALAANAYEQYQHPDERVSGSYFPKMSLPSMPIPFGAISPEDISFDLNDKSIDENIELGLIAALAVNADEGLNEQKVVTGTDMGDSAQETNLGKSWVPTIPSLSFGTGSIGTTASNASPPQELDRSIETGLIAALAANAHEGLNEQNVLTGTDMGNPAQETNRGRSWVPTMPGFPAMSSLSLGRGRIGANASNAAPSQELDRSIEMGLIAALAADAYEQSISPVNGGISAQGATASSSSGSGWGFSLGNRGKGAAGAGPSPGSSSSWGLGLGWGNRGKGPVTSSPDSSSVPVEMDEATELGLLAALGTDLFINNAKDSGGTGASGNGWGIGNLGFGNKLPEVDHEGIKTWLTNAFKMEGFDMGESGLPYPIDYPTDGLKVVSKDGNPTTLKLLKDDKTQQVTIIGDDSHSGEASEGSEEEGEEEEDL